MANKHYPQVGEEFEVTIHVKISDIVISNYHPLSELEQRDALNDFKNNIADHLGSILEFSNDCYDNIGFVDYYRYNIKKIKK